MILRRLTKVLTPKERTDNFLLWEGASLACLLDDVDESLELVDKLFGVEGLHLADSAPDGFLFDVE